MIYTCTRKRRLRRKVEKERNIKEKKRKDTIKHTKATRLLAQAYAVSNNPYHILSLKINVWIDY